jgi:hypothetical protein
MAPEMAELRENGASVPAGQKSVWRLRLRNFAPYNPHSQPFLYLAIQKPLHPF